MIGMHPLLHRTFLVILIFSIIFTLGFIFSNSTVSKTISAGQSSAIVEQIKPIVDPEDKIPADTFQHYVRKSAHFAEYLLLGFEFFALLILLRGNFSWKLPCALLFPLISALVDETLQVFSERGSGVIDVWLDFAGALAGYAACALVFLIFYTFSVKISKKRT